MAQRVQIKNGVDDRHIKTVEAFQDDWNKTEREILLSPRRVLEGCRILAKDKVSGKYWLIERTKWSVSGYEIEYDKALEYINEAKLSPPAHAEVFKNPDLYRTT